MSVAENFRERWSFARSPGGAAATGFWLVKTLLRVDIARFYAIALGGTAPEPPENLELLALRQPRDVDTVSRALEERLNMQTGPSVRKLLAHGDRVYALAQGDRIACQLNICFGTVRVDSPADLTFHFASGDAFLGFLYSAPEYRRGGLARRLIALTCADLAAEGWHRCLCHIRATNVPSLNTFRRSGWRCVAWLLTTPGGRMLGAPGASRAGIRISPGAASV